MHRFCTVCERTTLDGNLWCERTDCPAEAGHAVLNYGDFLGDLKVIRLLRVWRSSALYEAERSGERVLLKVANEGDEAEARLRREALLFSAITPKRPSAWVAPKRSLWPELLPPYTTGSKRAYGEISFRGETKVYSVFRHRPGKFLSDLMLENPQLWHQEAAWLIITLSEALQPLSAQGRCHLHLTPDLVLIDSDGEGHLRPLLLDLGTTLTAQEFAGNLSLAEPAYTAPELIESRAGRSAISPVMDVYTLGLIYYELLAGKPAFDARQRRDDQVRLLVAERHAALSAKRPELEQAGVIKVLDKALAVSGRFALPSELAQALIAIYARPPTEKRPVPRRTVILAVVLGVLALAVASFAIYVLANVALS